MIPAAEWNFLPNTFDQDKCQGADSATPAIPLAPIPESPYYLKVHPTELPNKRASDLATDDPKPDLTISNILASDSARKPATATIRRPYFPLKCPVSEQSEPTYANQGVYRPQKVGLEQLPAKRL